MIFRLLFLCCILSSCAAQQAKINGVSFVASRDAVSEVHTNPVVQVGANYAAIMPFGFVKSIDHPEIVHNTNRQWFGETRSGGKQYIEELRKKQIKIMVKPQIWIRHGEFTGFIKMTSEADWKAFEDSYSSFILEYAELAQETKAEILCIGTELENFIKERPDYWHNLIKKIKTVYKGKLTYAANWDEFKRTPFWSAVDFIGVDAYFPVSDKQTPSVADCKAGWKVHKAIIKSLSEKHNKPILFTEYGYRSMDFTGKEPWVSDHKIESLNFEGQANATQALFEEFWNEDWFAGGFVWKWFHAHDRVGGENDNQFTPQNKPAETVIQSFYSRQ
ncbi:glycoside hydrolase TIM-barrel-like domain-containing protein [Psychroserpens sp. SPM9]|uniref:glycoside hydrolase family 113 n=1 Tax=Psychroserpens sp. SPM9 TaxID=2975598 RepID=UPI0021A67DCE|nr:glycoside hydrolase TIM-barrel-like domain-containing protein [Psychroserpens sp. SPM9]MDG5490261.1 glycoside hydrolase [Psychroserpens sp. SPM9]